MFGIDQTDNEEARRRKEGKQTLTINVRNLLIKNDIKDENKQIQRLIFIYDFVETFGKKKKKKKE